MVAGNGALCIQPSRILDHRDARNTARRSRNPRSAAVPTAAATSEPGRWKFVAPLRVRSCCGGNPALRNPSRPRGFLPERGCVRGAPTAAGWPHGKRLISTGAYGVSGPLRLVLGGHSRAPLAAAPPLGPATLQNPRTTRGFYHRTNGQPGPPPTRQFPFLCPKFPCPTRPCSRAAPSTAANQNGAAPSASAAGTPDAGRRQIPLPALQPGTGRAPPGLRPRHPLQPCKIFPRADDSGTRAVPARSATHLRRHKKCQAPRLRCSRCGRDGRAPHGLRLCCRVFIVSLWFSLRFPLQR